MCLCTSAPVRLWLQADCCEVRRELQQTRVQLESETGRRAAAEATAAEVTATSQQRREQAELVHAQAVAAQVMASWQLAAGSWQLVAGSG